MEDAAAGKKIKLNVNAEDADTLRESGKEFLDALQGKIVKPQGQVSYGNVLMQVMATKPKGTVQIGPKTAVKMAITKDPMVLTCPGCGQEQTSIQSECAGCGQSLDVVII